MLFVGVLNAYDYDLRDEDGSGSVGGVLLGNEGLLVRDSHEALCCVHDTLPSA